MNNEIVPVTRAPVARPRTAPPEVLEARPVAARGRKRKQTNIRLWLPMTPLAILFSPLAVIALPLVAVADIAQRTKNAAMLVNGARVLLSMSGTEVAVRSRKANIHIWIF
jgi:hypothetical protein